jgi:isopenicillin N synthase-like dioxygenase
MKLTPIDIAAPGACVQFSDSLRDTGFAVLKLCDPSFTELLDRVYKGWGLFFNNVEKHSELYHVRPDHSGYFPFRSENSKDSKIKDLKEFFHIYRESDIPKGLEIATWESRQYLASLGETLLLWLDLCGDYHSQFTGSEKLIDMVKNTNQTLLRVLHYPPLNGDHEEGAVRAAAHEDINLITLLPAATTTGLQVKTKDGEWYDVPSEKGWVIVNAGDMLQEATSGYYKSTTHRVVNPSGEAAKESRYSMPLFVHPRPEVRLSTRYTAAEYLDERLKELGLK